ncbi:Wadjet anti-phage system protein JetD domain-containing protein [Mesorhizobium sp. WSM4313]|uniref:Wadjet anti-phage system protein JetD domain-containing protein n=1 Tax=Mesorhizobium sp. WSM4313 TaxID=2029412 RepID=UPI000BAF9DD9|nr:Wadjet anti-phage system protein JetD domain-containing protein [Mesorhizobium sp. WSM4313]PBB20377.1 hypothetical protein CK219_10415 [Mesorhizobium sp. WSM4313]
MSRKQFGDVHQLIHDLLDRHESNPEASRILAYIDEDALHTVEERDRFIQALSAVEAAGGIIVQRKLTDGAPTLGHVRLANAAVLYAHVNRTPAGVGASAALGEARARPDLPEGALKLLDEIASAWSRGVGRFGLAPGDSSGLSASLDLVHALAIRAEDGGVAPVDYRTFSRLAGTYSKALERFVSTVPRLFERLYPDRVPMAELDPADWLATLGVIRTPQLLIVSGPITIATEPVPPLRFYGVPPEQGDQLGLAAQVDYLLTIENYTSFVRHAREINSDRSALIIYTGGFPSRSHLRQIVRLAVKAQAPIFHWGDIDDGGVRIFGHLERTLAERGLCLLPHLMDVAALYEHGVVRDRHMRTADAPPRESAVRGLWEALVTSALVLEQESLSPRHPRKPI